MSVYLKANRIKGRKYWWLVEAHRKGNKIVSKRLKYIGRLPENSRQAQRIIDYANHFYKLGFHWNITDVLIWDYLNKTVSNSKENQNDER
jgi:hypothetical protein